MIWRLGLAAALAIAGWMIWLAARKSSDAGVPLVSGTWGELARFLEGWKQVDQFWCRPRDAEVYGVSVFVRDKEKLYCWADFERPSTRGHLGRRPPADRRLK